jgi:hypothetical protein
MNRILNGIAVLMAAASLAATDGSLFAQGKGKDKDKDKQEQGNAKGGKDDKPQKAKKHKHENGKNLVGDKVKANGKHKFHENGKHSAFVDVKDGKIAGVNVKHAEKGDVPVKKYKTRQKMADAAVNGWQPVSMQKVQQTYMGTTWIGYAYYDDYGDEVIYWFPYEMVYDGDTGAIEYYPA